MNYYITGDLHGELRLLFYNMPLTSNDTLIILGDFGCIWYNDLDKQKAIISMFQFLPYTVAFIDGNHENFDILSAVPVSEKWGGKVQQCARNVYHLCRGEVYNIYDHLFIAFGGATSHDKWCRKEGVNWWSQEMPNQVEVNNAISNLEKVNYEVDFIVTHCADDFTQRMIDPSYEPDACTNFLREVSITTSWKKWFIGHYHRDQIMPDNMRLIYHDIIQII